MSGGMDEGSRLERALEVYLAHTRAPGADPEVLLAAHEDLREFLEPMLGPREGRGAAAAGEGDGERLGDFRLVRELGRGGMGVVYEAWQRSLDRRVALKVLAPSLVADPASIARFRREASLVARLAHPGIVAVFGFGDDGGRHWFAMERVDGEPLHVVAARFRSPAASLALVAQVADALQHAHAAGLVHRDVKPANVLVRPDGRAVLTDFGLASDAAAVVTTDGSFLGTLEYASPEQVQGERVDARADVWAVGVVWYELLTGERPFARGTATATMHAILTAEPPDVRRRAPEASADLAAVVAKALSREPAARYASAAALLADLRALQAGTPVTARPARAGERLRRWARREPWRAATLLLLLAAAPTIAAGAGYLWANAPRLAAAREREAAAAREEVLTDAWLAVAERRPEPLERALAALGDRDDDAERTVVRAALLANLARHDEAREALRAHPERPGTALAQALLDARSGGKAPPAPRDEPLAPFECFVRGFVAFERARATGADGPGPRAAVAWFARAAATSPTPRAFFLLWWMVAAARAEDLAGYRVAETALEAHFPGSESLLRARAFTASHQPPERAVEMLQRALAEGRAKDLGLRFALATALDGGGHPDAAAREYEQALAGEPGNAQGWSNLGMCRRELGDKAGAVAALQKAVGLGAADSATRNLLGLCLQEAGRADDALREFAAAAAADPGNWRAELNLATATSQAGRLEESLAHYEKCLQLDPGNPQVLANLATALRNLGRPQLALAAQLRAAVRSPAAVSLRLGAARAAAALGLPALAAAEADAAIEAKPDDPATLRAVADVFLQPVGRDGARALAAARRAADLTRPSDPWLELLVARARGAAGETAASREALGALRASDFARATPAFATAIERAERELEAPR